MSEVQTERLQEPAVASTNVWDYKPRWCQPWSILLTGLGAIAGSWLLLRTWWITALFSLPVLAWMTYFLLIYPRLFAQYVASLKSK